MRYFCYDNAETHRVGKLSSKAPVAAKKRGEKICLKYNGENGCNFKSCTFKHSCIACEEPARARAPTQRVQGTQEERLKINCWKVPRLAICASSTSRSTGFPSSLFP